MLIEIRKVGFVNKGAELMLCAMMDVLRNRYPDADYAMAPDPLSAPYGARAERGFLQKASYWRKGIQYGSLAALIPPVVRRMYGVVLDRELDVVLDASGFGYSDQMGIGGTLELAGACRRWRRNGTKIVLLPQAFGPFRSKLSRRAIRVAIDNADIVFARDRISRDYLLENCRDSSRVKLAPDFTNLLPGNLPPDFYVDERQYCIVPNARMLQKTAPEQRSRYVPTMVACANFLLAGGFRPFILNHEGAGDAELARQFARGVNGQIRIVEERDPVRIKGILGSCDGVIASRYHALVSALSQGVPCLATGWSHKYQMLFEDYEFAEGILQTSDGEPQLIEKLGFITEDSSRQRIRSRLASRAESLKKETRLMWHSVFDLLAR